MEQTKKVEYIQENELNKVIFDTKNIEINQKLNSFIHSNIKEIIGLRAYLYHIQNLVFTAIRKNTLAVIGNDKNIVKYAYENYNYQLSKLIRETWKNSSIEIKYYYIQDGKIIEVNLETNFVEKQPSQVIYFNEAGNNYTFENFTTSEENSTAVEICKSIACYTQQELVVCGNIVYLHGEHSTGKTHLINAIYNFYTSKGGKVYNTTAGTFLRQYVDAVQKQNVFDFHDNILNNEIIIIDDIDDLIGKNGTLNELKKIILTAIKDKKYIIITGKSSPKILMNNNNLLQEILSNAISIKLEQPKEALKAQIAMNYICDKNMNIPITIVRDLVVNLNCNVRELKNYIKKLAIVKAIKKFELNTNLALEILSDDIKQKTNIKSITNEEILNIVADYYKLTAQDLCSKIKREEVCRARNVAIYFMKKINSANFQEIGRLLNRNHSTIISSLKNIENLIEKDRKLPSELADLQSKL